MFNQAKELLNFLGLKAGDIFGSMFKETRVGCLEMKGKETLIKESAIRFMMGGGVREDKHAKVEICVAYTRLK